jgi:RNA polymerase sigma-70 factor (ECF subfamily)
MPEPEDELLERAGQGDTDAIGSLYRLLAPRVVGYLRARGAEDPEGLCSEVFLQVFQRLGGVRGGFSGLRTFVFSVAHARLVDERRARARRPAQAAYDEGDDRRTTPSAETQVLDATAADRALALLDRLGEDQRAVIALRIIGELSIEETAAALGKSAGAVKQLQRRGLLELRKTAGDEVTT